MDEPWGLRSLPDERLSMWPFLCGGGHYVWLWASRRRGDLFQLSRPSAWPAGGAAAFALRQSAATAGKEAGAGRQRRLLDSFAPASGAYGSAISSMGSTVVGWLGSTPQMRRSRFHP